jgi:hypothetical protein
MAAAQVASAQADSIQQNGVAASTSSSAVTSSNLAGVPAALVGLNEQQVQMIQQFSVDSRLNLEWCK